MSAITDQLNSNLVTIQPENYGFACVARTTVAVAGQQLRAETSPGGVELFNEVVPAGKQWEVTVTVRIKQTDA